MKRQQSVEAHQSLQIELNTPNSTNCRNAPQNINTRQYQCSSQDKHRPSASYRQSETSDNVPTLKVGDAIQSGSNPVSYGTIKWIGNLPDIVRLIAGVEIVMEICASYL